MKLAVSSLATAPALSVVIALSMLPAGCADVEANPHGLAIAVAPLNLPGIADACYTLTVFNTDLPGALNAASTVWSLAHVCAGRYGDGRGDITYIGTCDADGGTINAPRMNTVRLELEDLFVADELGDSDNAATTWWNESQLDALGAADFVNPCPVGDGCDLIRPCVENADTFVEFNLSVMRSAKQGFFDVVVNLQDIFCSAKFDCQYPGVDLDDAADDQAMKLLFNWDGARSDTAVLGFACTAGAANGLENAETFMYLDDIVISCTNTLDVVVYTTTLKTSAARGGNQIGTRPEATAPVQQYAIYQGNEFPEADFNKFYWNVAIAFDVALMDDMNCTLATKGTASHGDAERPLGLADNTTPAGASYPYLVWNVALNEFEPRLTCGQNPIGSAMLAPTYTLLEGASVDFDNCGHDGGAGFVTEAGPCIE